MESNQQQEEEEEHGVLPPPTTRPAHPFVEASCLSKLLFIWPYHLMSGKHRVHNEITNSEDNTTGRRRRGWRRKDERAAIEDCDLPGENTRWNIYYIELYSQVFPLTHSPNII